MPMTSRRALTALGAATAMSLVLVGCAAPDAADDGTTEITLALQNPDVESADPATWAIVEAFEEAHPDVTVEITGQAVAEHLQSLSIAAQSDTLPEIFWVYKATAEDMLEQNLLLDLTPILDEAGITERLPDATIDNFTVDGVTYGVPYQGLLTGLWYNEAILAENGLTVPTTFEELLTVARTLDEAGVVTISNGANQSSFSVWSFLVWLERYGFADRVSGILDGTDSYVNDDFLRMYEHIAELRDAGAFASNVSTQTYQQAVDAFLNGNAAMLDAGVWASSAIQDSPVAGDVGFWIGAQFDDGVGDQSIVMNVASAPFVVNHKVGDDPATLDAVTRFIEFYYSDDAQQLLVENGQPPVTDYQPEIDPDAQSALKAAIDAATAEGVSSPESQPDLLVPTPVANAMYDSIYGVIQNQLTPQQALELVQGAIDAN
jgi:raffinose/stachyose/melibiose transport system substrate-binding protein